MGYSGASSLRHNFCVLRLALSDITTINASVLLQGFPLSAVKMKLHSSLCAQADQASHSAFHGRDLSRIHQRFAYPCLIPSPSPVTAVPSLCPTENMKWDRHRQAPVSEKLLVPQWATQSIFWVAPCAAAALVGGESPGPRAQWCSSLTASVLKTKVFLAGIVRLRQGLMLPVLPELFWWQSRNSGSSQSFGVKAWYSADSDWFWLLVFFYFLSQIGILLTNPNLVSWVTLYLLNFKVGLALEKKKKAFPP